MDGYKAHFSVRTLECARTNGILLFALPTHTSHFLQPLDICVFDHFKRALDVQIAAYQKSTSTMVDETNIVGVAATAFQSALTRSHLVDGFEKAGIYALSRDKMMASLVGNQPAKRKKDTILLKPTGMISDRTTRKIVRTRDGVDRVRVESMNHWLMEERVIHKKQKRDINAQIVSGACLMTSDESYEYHVQKEAEKIAKVREKEVKAQAKVVKAQAKQEKKVARLVAAELKARDMVVADAKRASDAVSKAEAKEAKRIAKAEAKEAKRIADAEEKEAKRIAKALTKEAKRVALNEQRGAAAAEAREVKRIAAAQANAEDNKAQRSANEMQTMLHPQKRGDAVSVFERSDLELKVITSGDPDTNVLYNLAL